MNKKAEIIIDTTVGQTEHISIKEIVKQGFIFGPIMCCATMSKVSNIRGQYSIVTGKLVHFLSTFWLPHSQFWAILRGQPHSSVINH